MRLRRPKLIFRRSARLLRGIPIREINCKEFMATNPEFIANIKTYAWYEDLAFHDGRMVAVKNDRAWQSNAFSVVDVVYGNLNRIGVIEDLLEY